MKRVRLSMFFIFAVMAASVYSQQKKTDSLLNVLSTAKEDSTKVELLSELFKEYRGKNIDTARMFATQAIKLAEVIGYKKGLAQALKNMGLSYYNKGKNDLVLEYWDKSLAVFRSIKDSAGESNILSNIGAVYMNQADDVKAAQYFIDALSIAEKINDKSRIGIVLNNIGTIYKHKPATKEKALQSYLRSLPLFEELKEKINIGTTSANIGEIYMEKKMNDSAIFYLNKSVAALENSETVAASYVLLGSVYDSLHNYKLAEQYHLRADSIGKKVGNIRYQIQAQLGLASVYGNMNNQQKSLIAYHTAEKMAIESRANIYKQLAFTGLARIYALKDDYPRAFKYQELLTSVKDSIYNADVERDQGAIIFGYEIEKKQSEINLLTTKNALADLELNRQKFAKNALIAGLGLVSLIIFILYRDYLNKAKTNKLLDSQKAQIQTLLSNILPDEVAQELQRDGAATPKFYESASVLFTDFKSFTKHADHMTPQEVIAELNSCFIAFDDIMEKYNLEKIKTIGDAYMCAGGIPVPDPNHYWNMIKAAKDIQATILIRNKEREAKGLQPWEIRIGIHVGPIVAGVVGKKKYAYDIWGSTVNIASRMESNGEPGQINISSATYELIKDEYECTHRGKIYAKNVGDVDMYFLGDEIKKGELKQENKPILVS